MEITKGVVTGEVPNVNRLKEIGEAELEEWRDVNVVH